MTSIQLRDVITVTDGDAPLSGITVVETALGDSIIALDANSGVAQRISISPTSGLAVQTLIATGGALDYSGAVFRQMTLNGVPTLFSLSDGYSAVQTYAIGADGTLAPPVTLEGSLGQAFSDIATIETGGTQMFIASHEASGKLTSFIVSAAGQMQILATLPESDDAGDISAIATATVAGQPLVLVASATQDSLTSFTLAPDGSLTQTDSRGAVDGLGINGPSDIKIVDLDGETFAVLAATQTSSLSVLQLAADGQMTLTDHINDNQFTRFQSVSKVETLVTGNKAFVLVGGMDDGLTLLMLLPDGTLQHLSSLAQTEINQLEDVTDIGMSIDGDQLRLFAYGQGNGAFSYFTYDISSLGDIVQAGSGGGAVSGGVLDDIILDGAGSDDLTGDAGADLFALTADGQPDLISDFQVGVDKLDLSRWGQVYSMEALTFTPLSNGIRIEFGSESLTVLSNDGRALTQSDFATQDVFTLNHTAASLHAGDNSAAIEGIVLGTEDDDILEGTSGDDVMRGLSGDDIFLYSAGIDQFDGGSGIDEVAFFDSATAVVVNLASAGENGGAAAGYSLTAIENIGGSEFDDHLTGDGFANQLIGWGGDDVLFGLGGDDVLAGGDGDDWLNGGLGADTLAGGGGTDTADYANATQGVRVDPRHLYLNLGEAFGDRYIAIENFSGGAFDDNLRGTTGANVIHGLDGNDWLFGRWGNDTLYGGDGDDVLMGGADADAHFGGAGRDRADYRESAVGIRVDLMIPSLSTGIAVGDTYDSIEDLAGGYASDNLRGDHNDNMLIGRSGDDVLFGRDGADILDGGDGNDTLYGGDGADVFLFTGGNDSVMDFVAADGDTLRIDAGMLEGQPLSSFGHIVAGGVQFDFGGENILEVFGAVTLEVSYDIIN
ncbi:calcium-binding protein [Litoreibacter janthinus]|nr:calcium-binding protein [Litoreibacter janthinus]